MLKQPDYINWLLPYNAQGPLEVMKTEAIRLLKIFDAKPFVPPCSSTGCTDRATRATVYGQELSPMCWCENCDPHKLGAKQGKIQIVQTYRDALAHVKAYCRGGQSNYVKMIGNLARSKGLGVRVGPSQAEEFFVNVSVPA